MLVTLKKFAEIAGVGLSTATLWKKDKKLESFIVEGTKREMFFSEHAELIKKTRAETKQKGCIRWERDFVMNKLLDQ